jgi:molybdenum cofactor sulfurtransferase
LSMDNHNSVHGIRKFASAKGVAIDYTRLTRPDLRIDMPAMEAPLVQAGPARSNLLAFPAQSNFSGVKHPLSPVDIAHHKGWDVLLDAAAFVPANRLDLQLVTPDFVAVSFYRMFGDPTGVGCLLIRNSALGKLKRHWFASWHGEFRNGSREPACSGTRRSGI